METTPLLRRKRKTHALCNTCIVFGSIIFAAVLFVALLAYSFKPFSIDSAISLTPERLQVLQASDDGLLVNVSVWCEIDGGTVLGLKEDRGVEWWEWVRRGVGRRLLDRVKEVEVAVDTVHVHDLLEVDIQEPLVLPVGETRLVSFTAWARPIATSREIHDFVQKAWAEGEVRVVASTRVRGWEVERELCFPGGHRLYVASLMTVPSGNITELVHLDGYEFETGLGLKAKASMPGLGFNTTLPFTLPLEILLEKEMAQVVVAVEMGERVHMEMTGRVTGVIDRSLSRFLQNYLHGIDNPITVRGMGHMPRFAVGGPPKWLLDLLPGVSVPLVFPGPRPKPKIVQTITIEQMKLSERAGKMRASGVVVAQVKLPEGMRRVEVNVVGVAPDVLVYDGVAGEDEADPQNPPERAFGRINTDYLDSETVVEGDGLVVTAPFTNVPLDVLPGRDSVLSDFVSKVVFKGGAQAGIKGTASVHVELVGLDGRVTLDDLPVQGDFWVGRRR